jgi:hypothetical protein
MRGIFFLCLIYASLPLLVLGLLSLASSGFPIFPLLTGAAIWYGSRKGKVR